MYADRTAESVAAASLGPRAPVKDPRVLGSEPYLVPILPPVPAQPPHFALWERERIKPSYDGVKPGTKVEHHPDMDYVEPAYDAAIHLDLQQPASVTAFDASGLSEVASLPPVKGNAPSDLAYTQSFRVLSAEGVRVLKLILKKYDALKYHTLMIPCMIRGLVYVSPFIKALNECPVLLAHVSKLAGLPLIPSYMQMQYSHTNVSLLPKEGVMTLEEAQANALAKKEAQAKAAASNAPVEAHPDGEKHAVIQWHSDPVPFVLILILSDLTGIEGGELQCVRVRGHKEGFDLLAKNGGHMRPDELLRCSYEEQGCGLLMQGLEIVHHVTQVRRAVEPRCTMVLSLMPANVHLHDRTVTSDWFKSRPQPPDAKQNEREAGFGLARGRAWRHAHELKALVEQMPYTEDKNVYLTALRDIRAQLDYTINLLDGTIVDSDDTK